MLNLQPSSLIRSTKGNRPQASRVAARRLADSPVRRRPGFTLVEVLTVIIIIGLLMALLIPAVMNARIRAMDARILNEISQIDASLKQFKDKYAVLPPALHNSANATNTARVRAFWRRAWPRWDNSSTTVADLSPAEVLVFYLGGVPNTINTGASSKVTGFNLNPLSPTANGGQRSTPMFQFEQGRLFDADGDDFYEYYPPQKRTVDDGVAPYTYFDFATYGGITYNHGSATTYGTATPYYDAHVSGKFMNADSFQIVCAGLDENYGANENKAFPTGAAVSPSTSGYNNGDNDNLTNFATQRLEEAKP